MLRQVLLANNHRAVVTGGNRECVGSIVIDPVLLEATGLVVNEKVLVADCESGARFETSIFRGEHGSGALEVNGAAANLTEVGNHLLIMSFASTSPQEMSEHRPRDVICDQHNGIADVLRYDPAPTAPAGVSNPG
ncbi:MAG: aspartate 1-decarboxylase [Planctomycetota bacterium]|jgi:aspartate 1-decarboxylase